MPYIGTQPTKVVSRQSANVYRYEATAGQTAFTGADLDNNVLACNPADMIVHMNGLRLESTDYTATTSSVTLTTAATSGDELTVTSFQTFEVADTYTKTAADTRYVNASGDTMTGALALPTGGLTVGTDQLSVDSAGRVTMPYQPAFQAFNAQGQYITGVTEAAFNSTYSNVGSHYSTSTGRFTAPVSGNYFFHFDALIDGFSGGHHFSLRKNGLQPNGSEAYHDGFEFNVAKAMVYYLVAGDYVSVFMDTANSRIHQRYGSFCGFLIG